MFVASPVLVDAMFVTRLNVLTTGFSASPREDIFWKQKEIN